ncbi:integral membrane ion antiporter [Hyphomicrobium denitrificans 1NES1]|uniref:Integral membrane ion antiporter n=1 Tax=Hyphomicrobium denitrificans 1NES1 TaxID=670307 RepID=N0BEE6_9HYPH|nr:integral membrane ion antiporter [Hyphomicrobium denitrificans 1NES1]
MRAAVTTAVARFVPEKRQRVRGAQLVGLAIAAIVPAIIWCVLIDAVAMWISGPLSLQTILITGIAIALFLAVICAPLILRYRD